MNNDEIVQRGGVQPQLNTLPALAKDVIEEMRKDISKPSFKSYLASILSDGGKKAQRAPSSTRAPSLCASARELSMIPNG